MNDAKDENWERETINKLAFAAIAEQRRARRWTLVFRGLVLVWMFSFLTLAIIGETESNLELGAHTALVEIKGVISDDAEASADNIITALRKAFKNDNAAGVIIRINSPGGRPVQSGYINDEIVRLRNKYLDKLLVCRDQRYLCVGRLLYCCCGRSDLCRQGELGGFNWRHHEWFWFY